MNEWKKFNKLVRRLMSGFSMNEKEINGIKLNKQGMRN